MKKESKENSETLKQIKAIISDPSYEVAEEDMALCEFVCTSKTEVQAILRKGFDYI